MQEYVQRDLPPPRSTYIRRAKRYTQHPAKWWGCKIRLVGLSLVHCLNDACVLGCQGIFHAFTQTLQGTIQHHILHHRVTNINTVMCGTTVPAVDLQWLDFGALELGLPGRVELRLLIVRTRRKGTWAVRFISRPTSYISEPSVEHARAVYTGRTWGNRKYML